jgi:prepilin-type processing-associated H-X9-DG protein
MRCFLLLAVGCLAAGAALLPADQPAELPPEQRESVEHLRAVGKAIYAYTDANRRLPANIGMDDKPLLSWRVALLPFLGEQTLYQQFNLNEPWDSEHNRPLVEKMPAVYRSGRAPEEKGLTSFKMFAGHGALLDPRKVYSLATITDGLAATILVIEAGDAVLWTRPADLPYDAEKPLPKLAGPYSDRLHVLMCDGSVRTVDPRGKDFERKLRAAVTPSGNERLTLE